MKKALLALLVLVLAAAAFWWWHRPAAAAGEEGEVKPVAQVQTAVLQQQSISRILPAYGIVEAAAAGAQVMTVAYDAVIQQVIAPVGAQVAAGDPILKLEPTPDALLQAESAKGTAALADRSLAAVRQRYDLKLATGDELRTAEQAAQDAKLKVQSYSRRGLNESSTLAAPSAAIVIKLDAQPGTVVPAGTALVTLGHSAQLQARLGVETGDVQLIKAHQPVTVTAVGRPSAEPVIAAVGMVGAVADPATGSVDVRVPLPAEGTWIAGEHVQAQIELEKKTALVAPRSAVLPDDNDQVLYTIKDHKAVRHVIQLGISNADSVEVVSPDVHSGDTVVTVGNAELSDGMDVQLPGEKAKNEDDDKPKAEEKAAAPADAKDKADEKPATEAKP